MSEEIKNGTYTTCSSSYNNYFVKIYDNLNKEFNGEKLKRFDKVLFVFIDYSCRLNRKCTWSNEAFVDNTGLSLSQIKSSLNNLERSGLITREKRTNGKVINIADGIELSNTFIKMYTEVSQNTDMTINDKFIYTVIHHLADGLNGNYLANNSKIAERTGCSSVSTVANSISHLKNLGYISEDFIKEKRIIRIEDDL